MKFEGTIAALVLATGVICGGIAAEEPKAPKYPPKVMTNIDTNPWVQTKLKPEHAILAALAGTFTTNVHLYSGPYPRKLDTEGTAEGKLLMGGAFVQLTHAENRMKQPFEAMTIYGFDLAIGKYAAASVDNTSTAIVKSIGTYDAEKKQIVMSGRFSDQLGLSLTSVRTVITFVDANTWTYDEFVSHKAGDPETKVVTITFKRS